MQYFKNILKTNFVRDQGLLKSQKYSIINQLQRDDFKSKLSFWVWHMNNTNIFTIVCCRYALKWQFNILYCCLVMHSITPIYYDKK